MNDAAYRSFPEVQLLQAYSELSSKDYDLKKARVDAEKIISNKQSFSPQVYIYACYVKGLCNVRESPFEADISCLIEAALAGLLEAEYLLAFILFRINFKKYNNKIKKQEIISRLETHREFLEQKDYTPSSHELFFLAKMYQQNLGIGFGLSEDYRISKSYLYYRDSAVQGNSLARSNLGWLYKQGKVPKYEQNDEILKAKKLFEEARAQNNPLASFNLGVLYLTGQGVEKDIALANQYFEESKPIWAELMGSFVNHTADGYYALAYCNYLSDQPTKVVKASIEKATEEALVSTESHFFLGLIYEFEENNISSAFREYKIASKYNNEVAKEFLAKDPFKAPLNSFFEKAKYKDGCNRMHAMAALGKIDDLEKLIKTIFPLKLKIDLPSITTGKTALHFAAKAGKHDMVDILIRKYRAKTNVSDLKRNRPLHLAAKSNSTKTIELLLNYESCKQKNANGKTPIEIAYEKRPENLEVFLKYRDKKSKKSLLELACDAGDVGFVSMLKKTGLLDQFIRDSSSLIEKSVPPAIHLAAARGQKRCVKFLLNNGDSCSRVDAEGNTVLMAAIKSGAEGTVKSVYDALLKIPENNFDACINKSNLKGETALTLAVTTNEAKCLSFLFEKREKYNPSMIIEMLKTFTQQYFQAKDFITQDKKLNDFIDSIIHCDLTGVESRTSSLKFLAQWYGAVGVEKIDGTIQSFERWSPEDFLALNIKLLFKVLLDEKIQLISGRYKLFIEELCHELEMLRARKDFIQCYTAGCDEARHAYIKQIRNQISALKDKESYTLNIGYEGHSMYISFTRETNRIVIQIDDLADLDEEYAHDHDALDTLYPRVFVLSLDEENKKAKLKILKEYLKAIHEVRLEHGRISALKIIYDFKAYGFSVMSKTEMKSRGLVTRKKQEVNNCVVENFKVGLESRLEAKQRGVYIDLVTHILQQRASQPALAQENADVALTEEREEIQSENPSQTFLEKTEHGVASVLANIGLFAKAGATKIESVVTLLKSKIVQPPR